MEETTFNPNNPANYLVSGALQWMYQVTLEPYFTYWVDHPNVGINPRSAIGPTAIQTVELPNKKIVRLMTLGYNSERVKNLHFAPAGISFVARFNQVQVNIYVPYEAVINVRDKNATDQSENMYSNMNFPVDFDRMEAMYSSSSTPTTESPAKVQVDRVIDPAAPNVVSLFGKKKD